MATWDMCYVIKHCVLTVELHCANFSKPLALRKASVRFVQGKDDDRLQIEIWQSWLEPATKEEFERQQKTRRGLST